MASVLNEESVEKKLRTVTNTQDSIQTLSLWIIHHKANHAKIVELWMKVLRKSASPAHRLTLFYLCNDVVQNCKKKKAFIYNGTFKECLREAASLVRDASVKGKVERIFNIWGERGVYDNTFVKSLQSVLNGQQVKPFNVREHLKDGANNRPVGHPQIQPHVEQPQTQPDVSEPHSNAEVSPQAEAELRTTALEPQNGLDAEESARILAEFKPSDMIDQVTAFLRQEVEIKSKATKLSHLKVDSTSLEAVKQLKDRSVGQQFLSQCDEASAILEDVIKRQTAHMGDMRRLMATLSLSEVFYEEQYREARIVANAYRNFGARINNMKKRLDELKKGLPEPDSPIPSPDVNAPSPENSPPFGGTPDYSNSPPTLISYSNSPPALVSYKNSPPAAGGYSQQPSWLYGDTKSAAGVAPVVDDKGFFPEAPSPDGSPPDLNLEAVDDANGSLDSRLASFFPRNQLDTPSKAPVYTAQQPVSVVTSTRPSVVSEDDGSTTPLDDEAPTTPLQDEHLSSPLKRSASHEHLASTPKRSSSHEHLDSPPKRSTPPKKENPIDFLSRLISQTQKTPLVKSGTQTFLDSLTMLTMVSKKPEVSAQGQQIPAAPAMWTPWTPGSTDNKTLASQPSSPSAYIAASSLPSSPETFPAVLPMVPPPMSLPIPPPPSLGLVLSMPPPPPPFVLTQALPANFTSPPPNFTSPPPNFTSPPPNFPQTSPGQKENWPELQQNTNHANSIRATHGSVLKELVHADDVASKSGSHLEHTAVDIDETPVTPRSNAETFVDAITEFEQKLKQKTSQAALKSRPFVPNPVRPNLMTLTASDDLDEADMIDEDTVVEETAPWSDKAQVSAVRSRSPSRDKDTMFQQPRLDPWSTGAGGGVVGEAGRVAGDGSPISSIATVVKQVEPFSRNNRNGNDGEKGNERLGENSNYWQQIDRKFDQCYKRGSRGRGNFRPFRGHRGSKDGVQAYTQAYTQAFQQFSQTPFVPLFSVPPPVDPRQPGYGQY